MNKRIKFAVSETFKILLGLVIIFPLIVMVIVGFMPKADVISIPFTLTLKNATLENYIYVLTYLDVLTYLKNTLIVIAVCVPMQIITALLAAYAFSFFDFPFKNVLFTILLMSMMIPGEVVIMTLFKMIVNWDLLNTYPALIITHMVSVGGVFMLRQNMLSIPRSLWDAARIDGCGHMRYFVTVMVPLCKPLIVTRVLESFIGQYNSHMWPMLVTTENSMRTVQVGIVAVAKGEHYGISLAAATIILVIPVVIYVLGLDRITEGLMTGAVKS